MTSFLPRTCRVCVEYDGKKMASESSPRGLKPAAAIQKPLQVCIEGMSAYKLSEHDLQRLMRRFAVNQEVGNHMRLF